MDGYWIHKVGKLTLNGVPLVNGLWKTVVVIIDVVANFLRGLDTNNRLGEGFFKELYHSHIQTKSYVECSLTTEEVKAFVLSKLVRPFLNHLSCCDDALSQHSLHYSAYAKKQFNTYLCTLIHQIICFLCILSV